MSDNEEDYEVLASVDWWESYQWSITALVQHRETRKLFLYTDGGCSCNSPFESRWWTSLEPVSQVSEVLQSGEDADTLAFNRRALELDWRGL